LNYSTLEELIQEKLPALKQLRLFLDTEATTEDEMSEEVQRPSGRGLAEVSEEKLPS